MHSQTGIFLADLLALREITNIKDTVKLKKTDRLDSLTENAQHFQGECP